MDVLGVELATTGWRDYKRDGVLAQFLDWTINGVRLWQHLGFERPLAESTAIQDGWELEFVLELLEGLDGSGGPLHDGRTPILVCQICGDLEDGVLSASVVRDGKRIVWSQFGWETPSLERHDPLPTSISFSFDADDYLATLTRLREWTECHARTTQTRFRCSQTPDRTVDLSTWK